jgi:hypothetical protein
VTPINPKGTDMTADRIYVYADDRRISLARLIEMDRSEVRTLYADGCTGLTALPDLPALEYLSAGGCTGLTALPDLPALRTLSAGGCTGLGFIHAGSDSRGYHFTGVKLRGSWRIFAGCRNFDFAQARAHWGAGGPSDRADCRALVEEIVAEAARRDAIAEPA